MQSVLFCSVILLGINSIFGQIIYIRELITIFYGNELTIGLILATWLFWVAIGSWVTGRIRLSSGKKQILYCLSPLIISGTLDLSVLFIRYLRTILQVYPGEIIGFIPLCLSLLFLTLPLCFILGGTFILACELISTATNKPVTQITPWIYLWESLGAGVSGVLVNIFLIPQLNVFSLLFLFTGINVTVSLLLQNRFYIRRYFYLKFVSYLLLTFFYTGTFILAPKFEKLTRTWQWHKFELIQTVNSVYGNITVTRLGNDFNFYADGLLLFNTGDKLSAEERTHYTLLQHQNPQKVLLLGGGAGGTITETLKHQPNNITYVELDSRVIKLAYHLLPKSFTEVLNHPKVRIVYQDAQFYVKQTTDKFDVVILDLPGPYTAQLNRFYSVEFFQQVKSILLPDGVFSFALISSENYIGPELQQFLSCMYQSLKQVFPTVISLPGDTNYFIAGRENTGLTYDTDTLIGRLHERDISTSYVNQYFIPYKLSKDRIHYLKEILNTAKPVRINHDFHPIGYFYDLVLWGSFFRWTYTPPWWLVTIKLITLIGQYWFMIPIILLIISGIYLFSRPAENKKYIPVSLAVGITGFTEILFQVVTIISFQIVYGYVFYKIGIILAAFMLGLVAGTGFYVKILSPRKEMYRSFIVTQIAIVVYPIILPLFFYWVHHLTGGILKSLAESLFTFLPIIAGFIGGIQFPLANRICSENETRAIGYVSRLYSIDLWGSCLGAVLVSIIFIPIIGIIQTCILAVSVNLVVLVLLFLQFKKTSSL